MGIRKQPPINYNRCGNYHASIGNIDRVANVHLKAFAAMLEAGGASLGSLTAVGRQLQQLGDSNYIMGYSCTFWYPGWTVRIISLEFGSRGDECRAWLSHSFDEWSGEFWIGVEEGCVEDVTTPPRDLMPGSWDSDDDTEDCGMMNSRHEDIEPQRTLNWRDLWHFSESRRRRRRLLRYCELGTAQVDALFNTDDMRKWEDSEPYIWRERNRRRVEQMKVHRAAGRSVVVECSAYPWGG